MATMTAPKTVLDLINRFQMHKDAYKASTYKETQVRREFIDPFFKALGWDIDNTQDYAEAYKDVVHEDALKIGGETTAPDYAFRIGGTRKFFLEAKKPSENIKENVGHAYQLRRYAWSAKLPLAILTDFEEWAVYDCRIQPNEGDKASVARISYFTFDKYAENWAEIESIFSREAILKGSFDKYADSNKRKRGTSEVDDAFLEEIEHWRKSLASNIALRNSHLSVRELNTAVQRTIDRIIFLRIAEDRGIENYGKLRSLCSAKDVYINLTKLFISADDRYNSGLFHFRDGDGSGETLDTFTLKLKIDDKIIKPILEGLYYPKSPYEFSVLSADILGHIYERFLGKVIRLSGKTAKIEEKPEVKKAGGVYYTPAYIAQYMVKNTVGALLEGKTPAQASGLDKRVKNSDPIRIVDPACGSGSFLIVVYQYLLDWYRDQYIKDDPKKHMKGKVPKLLEANKNDWRLTIAERRRILLTHIYGVDIDPQAVEVTKLSLLLKVLEGETADAMARQMDFFRIRALPDLGKNIRCGNSLIAPDFYRVYSMALFSDNDQINLNAFKWKDEFPFLNHAGGFDCVIGNPPYLYSAGKSHIDYFNNYYKFSQYQTDYYIYFTEKGLNLLKTGGKISYIIPDSWVNSDNFSTMRNKLINDWRTETICTFGYKVFRDANIENTIFFTSNDKPKKEINIIHFKSPNEHYLINKLKVKDINRISMIDTHYSEAANDLIYDIDSKFQNMGDIVDLNRGLHAYRSDGYGKSAFESGNQIKRDREEKSYHHNSKTDETCLPEVRGRDVSWLTYQSSGQYVSYGDWLAEPRNPKFMLQPKIVFRKTLGKILSASYIKEPHAIDQSLYIAIAKDNNEETLKFILGITSSTIGAWYLRTKYAIYDRLHPWYTKKQLGNFPIPPFSSEIVDTVNSLIHAIKAENIAKIEIDKRHATLRKNLLREQLDKLVFDAYELSAEQRQVIYNGIKQ